jgi:hypothetical protein
MSPTKGTDEMNTLTTDQIKALGELVEATRHHDDTRGAFDANAADARMYSAAVMCGELGIDPAQVRVVLDGREPMFPTALDGDDYLDLAYRFADVERRA